MNLPYLIKILGTDKLSVLVQNLDLPFLDIDLVIDDAVEAKEIEIDKDKDTVKALKEAEITFDSDLANKLLRVMQHRAKKEINITRGRLNLLVKNEGSLFNYPYHEYLMALHYLIDSGQISEEVVEVPAAGERPYHKFVFLQFPDNQNEEWNSGEVNKWIANFAKKK